MWWVAVRIALLSAEYPPQIGGVGDYTRCLARALLARGHAVLVVTGSLPAVSYTQEEQSEGANHADPPVYSAIGGWGWRCWRDTIATLDTLRPDILHIQYQTGAYGMHPAINLLPWRLRGLARRPRTMVTFHDLLEPYLFPKAGALRHRVTLRLARDADGVIVTNVEDGATLPLPTTHIPIGSNIPVAPPADYQRAAWRQRLGVQCDELLVAYFGLLSHSKGVDILLDAAQQALHAALSLRLLLIGGEATAPHNRDYAAEVSRQVERLGLSRRTVRTGAVDAATVSAHLLAADCIVLPFRNGASFRSGSLLAALTHGVPVITTLSPTLPPHPPHLIDGAHALLVPPDDRAALVAAMQRLATDAPLRTHLSSGARSLGAQFAWSEIAWQHEQCYTALW